VDPTWNEKEINATHIRLGTKAVSGASILGQVKFKLREVEPKVSPPATATPGATIRKSALQPFIQKK